LKISHYFTDLGPMIQRLSRTGIGGLVLFNRYFSPDIDIDRLEVTNSFVFSTPSDLAMSLRWIAIMAEKVDCDLVASTGIHNGAAVIKQLLAGANCRPGGIVPLQKRIGLPGTDARRPGALDVRKPIQGNKQLQGQNEPGEKRRPVRIRTGAVHEVLRRQKEWV
jgi:hypothetical protein